MNPVKMFRSLILLLLLPAFQLFSQDKHNNIWYFSSDVGIDFNSGSPVLLTNGNMTTVEGCASIADSNGALLFYTDGNKILNKNHVTMSNGGGLNGHSSSTQSALIIKKPGSNILYYVFTTDQLIGINGLQYSEVDMSQNGGLGKVTALKNVQLLTPSDEKVTAVQHANGRDFWVITHRPFSNKYYCYLVDTGGVNPTPVISATGTKNINEDGRGCLKASKCGNLLANALSESTIVDVLYFDKSSGNITHRFTIPDTCGFYTYGVEFSPDESKLYVSYPSERQVSQFDLSLPTPTDIINSQTKVAKASAPSDFGTLQLGPDDKIYCATFWNTVGAIQFPNLAGLACSYNHNAISLAPKQMHFGLPNCVFYSPGFSVVLDSVKHPSCKGYNSGYAKITIHGTSVSPVYTWNPNVSNTSEAHNLAAGTYTLTVSDSISACAGKTSQQLIITINEPPAPTFSDTATASVCASANGTATVTAGSNITTILWSNGDTTFSVLGLQAGKYSYIITDSNGCKYYDTVTVSSSGNYPIISGLKDSSYCPGDTAFYIPLLNGGTAPYTYNWNNGASSASAFSWTVNVDTTIILIVSDSLGCNDSAAVAITVKPAAKAVASAKQHICIGDSVLITASGGNTYLWTPSASLSNPSQAATYAMPATTTTYTVMVSKAPCAADTATVMVEVVPALSATAGPNTTICIGDSVQLMASGGSVYSWSPAGGLNSPTASNPIARPTTTTTYTVTVSSGSCAPAKAVVTIKVVPSIVAGISPDTAICEGEKVSLTASGGSSYLWSPAATLSDSLSATVTASPSVTTTYSVTVTSGSCAPATNTMTITVYSNPSATISKNDTIKAGQQISLHSGGGVLYQWSPGLSLSDSSGSDVLASPIFTTTYTVTITDVNGCTTTRQVTIFIEKDCDNANPFLPNAFSPNGDGINDNLELRTPNLECIVKYHLTIFNRWGEKVFESANPQEKWNGTYKGQACDEAVFDYFLDAELIDGTLISKNGNVSLVR